MSSKSLGTYTLEFYSSELKENKFLSYLVVAFYLNDNLHRPKQPFAMYNSAILSVPEVIYVAFYHNKENYISIIYIVILVTFPVIATAF